MQFRDYTKTNPNKQVEKKVIKYGKSRNQNLF